MQSYYNSQSQAGSGISDYKSYYKQQSGDGVGPIYAGYRWQGQRGAGWFGRVIKGGIVPLLSKILPYLGSKAVEAYQGMAQDFQSGRTDLKEIGKRQLRRSGAAIARDVASKLEQTGSGIRKRKRRSV